MRLAPGLRFQIFLLLAGLLAVAFALVAVAVLPVYGRMADDYREQERRNVQEMVARALTLACPSGEGACLEAGVAVFPRARLVAPDADGARRLDRGGRAVRVTPVGAPVSVESARGFLLAFLALDFAVVGLLGLLVFFRSIVRPLEALASLAETAAASGIAGRGDGHQVGRLGSSLRRVVGALRDERERVAQQVSELEAANRSLEEAQERLVRSEKLATVGRLAAGVAHEIGNPLGGLVGYLELLGKSAVDQRQAEFVDGAREAATRIDQTVRDLLDFSRPGAGSFGAFELGPAVEEALRLLTPQKRWEGVEVELSLPAELPPVHASRGGLTQVLVNLFLNAADAMSEGGRIQLGARVDDGWVRVTLRDEGPGLPEGAESEIFEPYFTTKEPGRGTGLGLAICLRLVEEWGGEFTARTHPDGGALFELTLPVAPEAPPS